MSSPPRVSSLSREASVTRRDVTAAGTGAPARPARPASLLLPLQTTQTGPLSALSYRGKGISPTYPSPTLSNASISALTQIQDPTTDSIIALLKARFTAGSTFTHLAHNTLVFCNPSLPSVPETTENEESWEKFAQRVLTLAVKKGEDQTVYLNGESGSGKTTAHTQMVKQITSYSSTVPGRALPFAMQILHAFTTAKSSTNTHASRVCTATEMTLNATGTVTAAKINTFCLDRNNLSAEDSIFHIFHSLFTFPAATRSSWKLLDQSKYHYMSKTGKVPVLPADNVEKAFRRLGFGKSQRTAIYTMLVAILQVGNLEFVSQGNAAQFKDMDQLGALSDLLQVDPTALEAVLTYKSTLVGKTVATQVLTPVEAVAARDGLARTLYTFLVKDIVEKINDRLAGEAGSATVTILDHPGLESGKSDLFTLCSNYVSEKVFDLTLSSANSHAEMLKLESMPTAIIEPYEGPARVFEGQNGLFANIRNDKEDYNKALQSNQYFSAAGKGFTIQHWGYPVTYSTENLIARNNNSVSADYVRMLRGSTLPYLQELCHGGVFGSGTGLSMRRRRESHVSKASDTSSNAEDQTVTQVVEREIGTLATDLSRKWFGVCIRAGSGPWRWIDKKVQIQVHGFQLAKLTKFWASVGAHTIALDISHCLDHFGIPSSPNGGIAEQNNSAAIEAVMEQHGVRADEWKKGISSVFFTEAGYHRLVGTTYDLVKAAPLGELGEEYEEDDLKPDQAAVDLEAGGIALQAVGGAPPAPVPEELTAQRRHWMLWVRICTFWIPEVLLIKWGGLKRPDVRLAWREKVALVCIAGWLSGIMIFLIVGFGKLLCPTQAVYSHKELAAETSLFVAINGVVWDLRSLDHSQFPGNDVFQAMYGQDASVFFPRRDALGTCLNSMANAQVVSPSQLNAIAIPPCSVSSNATESQCHDYIDFVTQVKRASIPVVAAGDLAWQPEEVASYITYDPTTGSGTGFYVTANNFVYDVSVLRAMPTSVITSEMVGILNTNAGRDISDKWLTFPSVVIQCMNLYSRAGVIDTRNSGQCQASSYSLLALTIMICSITGVKFLMALNVSGGRIPEDQDKYVILQVPCYTEDENSLRKTIDSLALLKYVDDRKLIFVVCDGVIKGAGNDRSTPELVLSILGQEWDDRPSFDFLSLGEGNKEHNKARVYSGWYSIQARHIPYLVVVKTGTEAEAHLPKPGNRGKRDSQIIMMKFLNRLHYNRPMVPLELELTRHIQTYIGVDPIVYEYTLMVDADTEVMPDSLNRLIAVMSHDSKIMGLCGETDISNELDTWITMAQVFEYYISHHLAKAFESMFGNVTCLPGCFCMYRIRTPGEKPQTLLIHDEIITTYQENKVDTLHMKNLLSLGEDRYLTTLMLKQFPDFKNKFTADATCVTVVPDKFSVLLSQRRRWINSTVHNLWELLRISNLCGCLCFSMRAAVGMDLFATLTSPMAFCYIVYLIIYSIVTKTVPTLTLYVLAATYGVQVVIFILRRKFAHVGWMVISIMAMPLFNFILPLYSFWHFDDFSWGNTRLVVGEKKDTGHGGPGEGPKFDPKSIPLMKWDEYVERVQKSSDYHDEDRQSIVMSSHKLDGKRQKDDTKSMKASLYSTRDHQSTMALSSFGYTNPKKAQSNQSLHRLASTDGLLRSSTGLDAEDEPLSGQCTDQQLKEQIRIILMNADLTKVTKRVVREQLQQHFGIDLSMRREFVNETIDMILGVK